MKLKLFTTSTLMVGVLSFSGVIAYRHELLGGPTPIPSEEVLTAQVSNVTATRLTPLEEALQNPKKFTPLPPEQIDTETLWLARVIFSETKRADEQALVAWVVRNRVDTRYRGKHSYQSVILDPYQFSAFRPGEEKGQYYAGLTRYSRVPGWQTALKIAHAVRTTEETHRPFSSKTRHFYSQRSMSGTAAPSWARGIVPVEIEYTSIEIDERRFRFYEDIS